MEGTYPKEAGPSRSLGRALLGASLLTGDAVVCAALRRLGHVDLKSPEARRDAAAMLADAAKDARVQGVGRVTQALAMLRMAFGPEWAR